MALRARNVFSAFEKLAPGSLAFFSLNKTFSCNFPFDVAYVRYSIVLRLLNKWAGSHGSLVF